MTELPAQTAIDPAYSLAKHVSQTDFDLLAAEAVDATKRDVLDTLGVMLGGSGAPGIDVLTGLARKWGGREEASLLVLGGRFPAHQAAQLNSAMGHALDFDDNLDTGGNIHPGTSVLAASLAAAESLGGVAGTELMLAVTLGLDVSCRLALAAPVDRGWHRTASFGIFGATAAAGKLLGLNEDQLVHAFGIAYSQAAGNRQCIVDGALTKRFQAGQAALGGVLAATLAREGFTGAKDVFAGRFGFFPMYQPEGYDLRAIGDGLGEVFRGQELSHKPYPCVRTSHGYVDAAIKLHQQIASRGAAGAAPRAVSVVTDRQTCEDQFAPPVRKDRPRHQVEAQFSLTYLIACGLVLGRVGIGEIDDPVNESVMNLAERIAGRPDDTAAKGLGWITVTLANGEETSVEITGPSGSPQLPLSAACLEAKFRDCADQAARPVSTGAADRAIELVYHPEMMGNSNELISLFTGLPVI